MYISKELEQKIIAVYGENDTAVELLNRHWHEDLLAYIKTESKEAEKTIKKIEEQKAGCQAKIDLYQEIKESVAQQKAEDELHYAKKYRNDEIVK